MNNRDKAIRLLDESLDIVNSIVSLSENETAFINKYSEHLRILKDKIGHNEIDMDNKYPMTGLFRWLGEHDSIVNRYKKLYDNIYELEMVFTKRNM